MKWGINDAKHCTITDVWFLTHYCTTRIDNTTAHINTTNIVIRIRIKYAINFHQKAAK